MGDNLITRCWGAKDCERLVIIMMQGREPPSDKAWQEALDVLTGAVRDRGGKTELVSTLAISDGGAPTAAQRSTLKETMSRLGGRAPVAVITDDTLVRAIVHAFRWMNDTRAFAPTELDQAITYTRVPEQHRAGFLRFLTFCQREYPLRCLKRLAGFDTSAIRALR